MTQNETTRIQLDQIVFPPDRTRADMGDIDALAYSIKTKGLINPITVEEIDGEYKLLAGGRRYTACKTLGHKEVRVRVYQGPLTPIERKSIELEENIRRKDLEYTEEVNLQREIHNLQIAIHGSKIHGTRTDLGESSSGHGLEDTALLLGRSVTSVHRDIKLANVMEQFPEFEWDKCKNKTDAIKLMSNIEEKLIRGELARRASDAIPKSKTHIADSYIVGDFFEMVKKVPSGSIDLVEVDPPYGIDLPNVKQGRSVDTWYNEVSADKYPQFIDDTLSECWRVMNSHSWLIFWFAPEPWTDLVFNSIIKHGFDCTRLHAVWIKSGTGGQTNRPDIHLPNLYEPFFYARKGDAAININKQGSRSNVFDFAVVPSQKKIHPTERPLSMMKEILSTFAYPGARIMVPYAGSGNTILAAYELGMTAFGYDIAKEAKAEFALRLMGGME